MGNAAVETPSEPAAVAATPAPKPAARASRGAKSDVARAFAIEAARLMHDDKCENVVVLDVRPKSQVTDYIVIGTGTSERQMRSVLHHVQELGDQTGYTVFRSSTDERATWLLADFVNVVVHVFEPNTRAHYDLEMMWGDAKHVVWKRRGSSAKTRPDGRAAGPAGADGNDQDETA